MAPVIVDEILLNIDFIALNEQQPCLSQLNVPFLTKYDDEAFLSLFLIDWYLYELTLGGHSFMSRVTRL